MTQSFKPPMDGVRYAFLAFKFQANDQDYENWLKRVSSKSQNGQYKAYANLCDASVEKYIELETPFDDESRLRAICYAAGYYHALLEVSS